MALEAKGALDILEHKVVNFATSINVIVEVTKL
jgi:hypothetical protein